MKRTRLRPFNPERRARQYARNFKGPWEDYDHAAFVRSCGCIVHGCLLPAQAAHATARGMGGVKGSWKDLFPACWLHHSEYDAGPERFCTKYNVSPQDRALVYMKMAKALKEAMNG